MLSSLAVLLAGCVGGGSTTYIIEDEAPYGLAGMKGKKTYTGLIGTPITQWNYMGSQEAADSQHFANFVDGLILHNEYGVLERNLAEKVTNQDDKVFTFKIRDKVPWVKVDGTQYKANGKDQYVSASDWVTTAKYICTFSNESPLLNFYMIFVKGAAEYYYWTYIQANSRTNKTYSDIIKNKNYTKAAEVLMQLIQRDYPTVFETAGYNETPITAEDIENIDNFSRVGVTANDATRELKYELFAPAFYFPTVLSYSAFLPTNAAFLASVGEKAFGTDNDKILYCGPFINSAKDDNTVVYTRNKSYWNPKVVHVDKITYNVIPATETNSYMYMRDQYEAGNIDGFSLNPKD